MAIGDSGNISSRLASVIPSSWFGQVNPNQNAMIQAFATVASWAYGLIAFAKLQTRISTASGIFLDIMALDFFGRGYSRNSLSDSAFRTGIKSELLRLRGTRPGLIQALIDLTGRAPKVFYPALSSDTGGYGESIRVDRASLGTYFDSTGALQTAQANQPRYTYSPTNLPAGATLLIEPARTNVVRNNTMVGSAVGALPSGWLWSDNSSGNITLTIVGVGVENGIPYVDARFAGTATNTAAEYIKPTNAGMAIPATVNQAWTNSCFIRVVGGSLTNVSAVYLYLGTNHNTYVSAIPTLSVATINLNRQSFTQVLTDATGTYIQSAIAVGYTNGLAIDVTLRIGAPQLELGPTATSVILTSTGTVTRAADNQVVVSPAEAACYAGGYGIYGGYGSLLMPYQCLVTAYRPSTSGIPSIPGYGSTTTAAGSVLAGYGVTGEYANMGSIIGAVTDAQIYATIAANAPIGVIPWTHLSS